MNYPQLFAQLTVLCRSVLPYRRTGDNHPPATTMPPSASMSQMDDANDTSHSSPEESRPSPPHPRPPHNVRGRPCDVCRKRKLKCVKESGQPKCVLCQFHMRDCTYVDEPRRRRRARPDGNPPAQAERRAARRVSAASPSCLPTNIRPPNDGQSLLSQTLGLHRTTHSRYVGSSSLYDGLLLGLSTPMRQDPAPTSASVDFRRAEDSALFITRHDEQVPFFSDDLEDLDSIEAIVSPYGPSLVDLYFRIVHPSYPILHKGVFLEKYARSYREFSPPLLASVYLLAMDWWEYDEYLAAKEIPDGGLLIRAATKAMGSVIHRPKLSTIQAGLLLLQRSGGGSWVLTSQLVAVAEELGLLVDCSTWDIPDWEKGLRRRLSWAVFMQDKWGALIHGRPSHVLSTSWRLSRLSLDDFPESAADEDDKEGSTEVEKGRHLFIHLTRLTELMSEALDTLYGSGWSPSSGRQDRTFPDTYSLLNRIKPICMRLRQWARDMPPGLQMNDLKSRKLCSNGYLHLSYFATEIMIQRQVVRALYSESDPSPELENLCRGAARSRLEHAMAFVESLRPEHLQGFWWFATPNCLALIGVYGALLWATSTTDNEAELYRRRLDDFKWSLKVRAKSSRFVSDAIQELNEALGELDMKRSIPRRRNSEIAWQNAIPEYPTQADQSRYLGNITHSYEETSGQEVQPQGAFWSGLSPDFGVNPVAIAPTDLTGLFDLPTFQTI